MKPTEMTNEQITEALTLLLTEARWRAKAPFANTDEAFHFTTNTDEIGGVMKYDLYATFKIEGAWHSTIGSGYAGLDDCLAAVWRFATKDAARLIEEAQELEARAVKLRSRAENQAGL